MTLSEAIKWQKQLGEVFKGFHLDIEEKMNISCDIAIKSLKKQAQKKVKYEDVGYDQYNNVNVYACICPSCGLEIIRFNDNDVSDKCESDDTEEMFHSSMVHHAYIGLNNYCNRCGQKLDWGDEK